MPKPLAVILPLFFILLSVCSAFFTVRLLKHSLPEASFQWPKQSSNRPGPFGQPDSKDNPNSSVTPTPEPSSAPSKQIPKQTMKWGAYVGGSEAAHYQQFASRLGSDFTYLATFVHWGNERNFPQTMANLATANDHILVIFWEAMDYNHSGPLDSRFNYQSILSGTYDSYLENFAQSVRGYGRPVIIVPFEEMNGDWYPWSITINGNSPQQHVAAFRYLKNKFAGVDNVQFAWVVNDDSVPNIPENQPENYYPGSDVVDLVGVDGFNFGQPWESFAEIFAQPLQRLTQYQKPILIFSTASAAGPQKAVWISQALTEEMPKYPLLQGFIWFNENKEENWLIWSDQSSLQAFQQAIASWPFVADPD